MIGVQSHTVNFISRKGVTVSRKGVNFVSRKGVNFKNPTIHEFEYLGKPAIFPHRLLSSKHPGSKFELPSLSGLLTVWGKQLACEDLISVRRQGDQLKQS